MIFKGEIISPAPRKTNKRILLILVIGVISSLIFLPQAKAGPTGGQVISGAASIAQSGPVTDINQTSQKAAINWQKFSVDTSETVNFNQPSTQSVTLNRVVGNERSVINGAMNAKGKVYLVNSSGVLFGKGAKVNVGSMVASTLNISDEDFKKDNYVFNGNGQGQVVNQGNIKASDGGYVALMGAQVVNEGVLTATSGTVSLNSAEKVTLSFEGDSLVNVSLDKGTLNGLVDNKNVIMADGGKVFLTAKSAGDIWDAQVNNSGLIQARTIADINGWKGRKGRIELYAYRGQTKVAGVLDASAPKGGDGGFIETSGSKVKIADEAKITTKAVSGKTGTWLIDPVDYVIAPSGGDDTGKTISARLGDNSVTIILSSDLDEAGDLIVADSISWSSNNTTLTLQSNNNVFINAAISATGDSAGLVLRAVTGEVNINAPIEMGGSSSSLTITYGKDYNILTPASFSGTVIDEKTLKPVAKVDSRDDNDKVYGYVRLLGNNSTLKINDVDYNLLQNASDLEAIIMNNDSIRYGLVNNIQLDSTYGRNAIYSSATSEVFNGIFAGLGNTIFNLKINNTTTTQYTGLFQRIGNNGLIRDLGIKDAEIKASSSNVGILAGNNLGTIKNVYATGLIDLTSTNAVSSVGGLVGSLGANSTQANGFLINSSFTIVNIISTLTTSTGSYIGGLVGRQYGQTNNESVIQNSHTTGNIQVSDRKRLIGGLVGYASGTILNSYATGSVLASNDNAQYVGGLVGIYSLLASTSTSLTNSFATGSVTGKFDVGGLIGSFTGPQFQFTIDNCYAIGGDVTGNHENVGGLIGSLIGYSAVYQIFIKNSYSDKNILLTHNDPDNTYQSHGSVGGLIGYAAYAVINNSYSRGTITSSKPFEFKIGEYKNTSGEIVDLYGYNQNYGGLIGLANTSLISSSWSDVSVNTDADNVGGLVGQMSVTGTTQGRGIGYIVDSYARGEAKGANAIGGLVGGVSGGYINNSWASGNVIGSIKHAGGLIGYANTTSITDSYASGRVSGVNHVAGFVGGIYDTVITGSFFNVETTGQDNSVSDVVYTNNSYEISGLSNENFNDAEYVEALRNGTLQNLLDKREQEWQAEQDRIREEARLAQEAEETRLAEEARLAQEAEEARVAEEARLAQKAEEARVAEEASVMAEFIQKTVITSDIGAKVINQQRELSFSPIKLSTNSITGAQELHPAKLETLISGNNFNSTIFTVPSIDSINFNAEIQGINVQSNYTNSISGSEKEPYEQNINIKEF